MRSRSWAVALWMVSLASCGGQTAEQAEDPSAPLEPDEPGTVALPALRYPQHAAADGPVADGILLLNRYRSVANLDGVAEDPEMSASCLGHLKYLDWESNHHAGGACLLSHSEDNSANPFKGEASAKAGAGALLACREEPGAEFPVARAVERWVNSLYHRIPLLDPQLQRVGAASYEGYTCLFYAAGVDPEAPGGLVLWPPSRMIDVPTSFPGNETPCPTHPQDPLAPAAGDCPPSGFIITASWYGTAHPLSWKQGVPSVGLTLQEDGSAVSLLALYAAGVSGLDPVPGGIPDTIALVPASPLKANQRVGVTIDSQTGAPVASWSFATGTREQ